jgi:hypothetical protein
MEKIKVAFASLMDFCKKNKLDTTTSSELCDIVYKAIMTGHDLGFTDAQGLYKIERDKVRGEE